MRGLELDGDTLEELANDSEYIETVRVPHQSVAGRTLLTLLHHGYGLQPLSADQVTNPFHNSALTWLRVYSESKRHKEATTYFAEGTRCSVMCQYTPAHVDGV